MITKDKVIEIFCIIDEFDKNLSEELSKNLRLPSVGEDGIRHRNRPGRLSESEIMIILVCYHFGPRRIIAFSTTNRKPCLSILKIPPN